MKAEDMPLCWCGHGAQDHNDNRSHTAVPFCRRCGCNEYEPPIEAEAGGGG